MGLFGAATEGLLVRGLPALAAVLANVLGFLLGVARFGVATLRLLGVVGRLFLITIVLSPFNRRNEIYNTRGYS